MKDILKEKIACLIIKMLIQRNNEYSNFEMKGDFSVFQSAFIDTYSSILNRNKSHCFNDIDIYSKINVLNNIVDNTFFERTAQILSDGEKRKFNNLTINKKQQSIINEIISSLKNNKSKPNLKNENKLIFSAKGNSSQSIPNFDADVYYEDENDIVAIEIKTVKPNSGVFKVEKEKILMAKAALKNLNPDKNIYYYLAFPFDPLNSNSCGFDKKRFFNYSIDFKKFFDNDEVLLADEFWNFLSGENETMQSILGIINSISKPDFMTDFTFINDPHNYSSDKQRYMKLLNEWCLFRESSFIRNKHSISGSSAQSNKITKLLNQYLFDSEGKYREDRINFLINFN